MPDVLEKESRESAKELIEQIQERSREIESTTFAPPERSRWTMVTLAIAIVASGSFLAWDLTQRTESPVPFDEAGLEAGLEFAVFVTASGIEDYRERTGSLPETLEEAGLDHPLVEYVHDGDGYRLVGTSGTSRIEFAEGD
ncbi:MAG: hypothetical protein HKO53_07110, partial [Gemmatimonadetes bacterium]|nr:hypothetical protein [Gemmatimonadota bacterium]